METYTITKKPIRLGFNMDNVLFDFEFEIMAQFKNNSIHFLTAREMYDSIISDNNIKLIHKDIIQQSNFYLNLRLIENSLEAFEYLSNVKDRQNDTMFELYIIGKPIKILSAKFDLIKKYFGKKALKNTIFINDKTIINLDILIDAKKFVRGINGSSAHHLNSNAEFYPNKMSFQHIRYYTPFNETLFNETEFDYPVINNWTDGTYKDVIIRECVKLGLITTDLNLIPNYTLTISTITGKKTSISVKPNMTLINFKKEIEHFVNLIPHEQKLYLKHNHELASHQILDENNFILRDLGIKNNSKIIVLYKSPTCSCHC
ncbi:putative 5' nucleotidase [Cotonvirus japonicus]|uniref:5' nucleotidase n=1 Tax=Cotonvirus japonicus TaxID=2811091 RepID=A0ABM7NUD5_9VIRU|nr:putative 5' nucleotidase [Cotonvirus japonicus]BCS83677.1 putative 5' nucleotidase [Cotonvirus japonicus]